MADDTKGVYRAMELFAGLTTGRIVHVDDGIGRCQAAIVAAVLPDHAINALLIRSSGTPTGVQGIPHSADHRADGSVPAWHWPERA